MDKSEEIMSLSFQLMFGIIGMILLTVFIIVFFVIYQRRLLQQQLKAQERESAYQKELLNAGLLAQEAERERIAVELHDSIGGLLSATKLYLTNVVQELSTDQFMLFKSKALETINENIKEVRIITNDLFPQSLERLGVVAASRDLSQKLEDLKGIQVIFSTNADERFEKNREKTLFRILQELIHNTLKHSNAEQVEVLFDFQKNQLDVQYKEDGQGFDRNEYEKQPTHKSFGLKNMESRIAFLNGTIHYTTAPGEGVDVHLSFPLFLNH